MRRTPEEYRGAFNAAVVACCHIESAVARAKRGLLDDGNDWVTGPAAALREVARLAMAAAQRLEPREEDESDELKAIFK